MAKGCIQHAIEHDHGAGWMRVRMFRASPDQLPRIYEQHIETVTTDISVRMVEMKVLYQRDRELVGA